MQHTRVGLFELSVQIYQKRHFYWLVNNTHVSTEHMYLRFSTICHHVPSVLTDGDILFAEIWMTDGATTKAI